MHLTIVTYNEPRLSWQITYMGGPKQKNSGISPDQESV